MLRRFHLVPERNGQTDGQTDRRTDLLYQYRASVCCRAIKMCVQGTTRMVRRQTVFNHNFF